MIIMSHRVAARDLIQSVSPHVFHGAENDAVALLAGGVDHLRSCVEAAEARGITYAARHWKIAPQNVITDQEAWWITRALAREFGFSEGNITLVRHEKPRHLQAVTVPHFHLIVPEYDPENSDKVLKTKHDYLCHEKVARIAEHYLRHPYVPGPHHAAVVRQLDKEGRRDVADAIRDLPTPRAPGTMPTSYSAGTAAQVKRAGLTPAAVVKLIRETYALAVDGDEMRAMLAPHGITIAPGEKRPTTPCMYVDGAHVEALHRLLGIQIAEVRRFLAAPPAIEAPPAPPQTPPPAIRMLSSADINEELLRQLTDATPKPVDRARLDHLEESMKSGTSVIKGQGEKNKAEAEQVAALEASAEAMGFFGRKLFRRRQHAAIMAEVAEHNRLIADRSRFLRDMEATMDPIRRDLLAERKTVKHYEASRREAFEATRRRLLLAADMIKKRDLVFADLAELQDFLTAPDSGPRNDMPPPTFNLRH